MEWAHIYNHLYMYIDALAWPTSFHKKRTSIHDIMLITSDIEKTTCTHFRRWTSSKLPNVWIQILWPHLSGQMKRTKISPLGVFQIWKVLKSKIQKRFQFHRKNKATGEGIFNDWGVQKKLVRCHIVCIVWLVLNGSFVGTNNLHWS